MCWFRLYINGIDWKGNDVSYQEIGGQITMTCSGDEYSLLLMALGMAAGSAHKINHDMGYRILDLANTLNSGNPHWRPYLVTGADLKIDVRAFIESVAKQGGW